MTHPCPFQPPPACVQLSIGSCLRRAPPACIALVLLRTILSRLIRALHGVWGTGGLGWGRGRLDEDEDEDDAVSPARARHQSNCQSARARQPPRDDAPPTRDRPCCAQFQFQPADRERPGLGSHAVASLSRCARGSSSTHQHAHVPAGGCMPARIRSVASQPCTRQAHHAALPGYGRGFVPLWNLYGSFMAVSCQSPALAA